MTASQPSAELPPGPAGSPSETTFQWLARPYAFLDECAAAYGDCFTLHFRQFGTHVVVSHPDDVRDVLTGDPHVLHAGRGNALLAPILGRHSLLVLDGQRHAAHRAQLQPAFRNDRTQRSAGAVAQATRRWTASWNDGDLVTVQQTALEISRDVILGLVFGVEEGDRDRCRALIHELMTLVGTNAAFDDQLDGTRVLARFRAARGALHEALQEHIDRRRQAAAEGADDVLAALLVARTPEGEPLPDDEIRDQLVTMLLAGHETTASAITWALLCLQTHPAALRRLVHELDEPGPDLPDERLGDLPYVQAACLETLRLRPVIPVVSREVTSAFRLRDRTIPPGVFVTPCAYLAHRRPEPFPEPDVFRPERFLGGRFSPYAYFPFGGGVRRCMGMSLALLEMQIVLGMLLRTFRFAPAELAPIHPVRRAVTIVASGGGRMYVERRRPAAPH
jgi:cytochrome P450